MTIGKLRLVFGTPGWGWKLYGFIWRGSKMFVGVSIRDKNQE